MRSFTNSPVLTNNITTNLAALLSTLIFLFLAINSFAQAPCTATRWTKGATWKLDGTIDDRPNAPIPNGIVRCGSAAETQSSISPNGVYNPNIFTLPTLTNCINPVNNNSVDLKLPVAGQPITWLNFDVRAFSGGFDFQVIGGPDNIGWALFYTNKPTAGTGANNLSGDCNDLTYDICGTNFTSGWAPDPFFTPDLSKPTNYYVMVWDQDGGDFTINFKARYGCGDAGATSICRIEEDSREIVCNESEYELIITVSAINGSFTVVEHTGETIDIVVEPEELSFDNPQIDPNIAPAILRLRYPIGADYDVSIKGLEDASCSLMHITGTSGCEVTPVELIHFDATCANDDVMLSWITASETENDYFQVERSRDGRSFEAIGIIEGYGTSSERQVYEYTDEKVKGRTIYYRLKQVDLGGTYEYSQIISIDNCGSKQVVVDTYPNPTNGELTLQLEEMSDKVEVSILNITGKLLQVLSLNTKNGYLNTELDMTAYVKGTYLIRIRGNEEVYTKKVIKSE